MVTCPFDEYFYFGCINCHDLNVSISKNLLDSISYKIEFSILKSYWKKFSRIKVHFVVWYVEM